MLKLTIASRAKSAINSALPRYADTGGVWGVIQLAVCIQPVLVESCRRLGVTLKDYLLDVLPGPDSRKLSEIAQFTPSHWATARICSTENRHDSGISSVVPAA
ncbi:MAG: hypothetical protein JST11_26070 [Acidobacteria bacterium]|nr:hypothetical protein [Acidobacteriota bacterium]